MAAGRAGGLREKPWQPKATSFDVRTASISYGTRFDGGESLFTFSTNVCYVDSA